MNPYIEDGPRARLSFDRAYCKRCIGPPSVNDGYIRGPGPPKPTPRSRFGPRTPPGRCLRQCAAARPAAAAPCPLPRRHALPKRAGRRGNAIVPIETLVRQRSNGAFIMRV